MPWDCLPPAICKSQRKRSGARYAGWESSIWEGKKLPYCWLPCELLYFFLSNYSKLWRYCIKFVKNLSKRNKNQKFKKKTDKLHLQRRMMKLSYLEYKGLSYCLCSIPPIWYMIWTTFKDKSRIVSIPVTNFGSQLTALFVNVRMQNSFQERKKNGTLKAQRSTEPMLPWKMPLHRYQSIHGLRLCAKLESERELKGSP